MIAALILAIAALVVLVTTAAASLLSLLTLSGLFAAMGVSFILGIMAAVIALAVSMFQ